MVGVAQAKRNKRRGDGAEGSGHVQPRQECSLIRVELLGLDARDLDRGLEGLEAPLHHAGRNSHSALFSPCCRLSDVEQKYPDSTRLQRKDDADCRLISRLMIPRIYCLSSVFASSLLLHVLCRKNTYACCFNCTDQDSGWFRGKKWHFLNSLSCVGSNEKGPCPDEKEAGEELLNLRSPCVRIIMGKCNLAAVLAAEKKAQRALQQASSASAPLSGTMLLAVGVLRF